MAGTEASIAPENRHTGDRVPICRRRAGCGRGSAAQERETQKERQGSVTPLRRYAK